MALIDDINALPTTVGDGNTGHLNNHQVIHAALKDHESRLGVRTYSGVGPPSGSVAAPVGSTYVDTAATSGAIRWVKTVGSGPSGWTVEYGSTGMRRLDIPAGFTTAIPTVMRMGSMVTWIFHAGVVASNPLVAYETFHTIPAGFRPSSPFRSMLPTNLIEVRTNGTVVPFRSNIPAGAEVSGMLSYHTSDAWPTTLPGTPA